MYLTELIFIFWGEDGTDCRTAPAKYTQMYSVQTVW